MEEVKLEEVQLPEAQGSLEPWMRLKTLLLKESDLARPEEQLEL